MKYKFADIAENSVAKRLPTEEDRLLYIGLEHLESGSLSISHWGSAVPLKGEKLIMKKGDILFGKRNTYLRRASIAPHDGLFSAHGMVLRPKTDVVCEEYFPFFVNSDQFFSKTIQISVGSLSPTVNWKDMRELEFDLPPLDRQRELAELLWAANDLKEKYKKLITASDEMLKAKFREMFGEKDASSNGYRVDMLSNLLVIERGGSPRPISKFITDDPAGINWIKIGDVAVGDKYITKTAEKIIPEGERKSRRVYPGDFLLSNSMSFGRPYILKIEGCIHDGWLVLRDEKGHFDKMFLYYLLQSDDARRFFESMASGSTVKNLNKEWVGALRVCVPPLDLQRQFVEIAAQEEKAKANLKKSIADVDNIIKGLING